MRVEGLARALSVAVSVERLGGCTAAQAVRLGSRTVVQVSDAVPAPLVAAVARHLAEAHRRTGYCHAQACPDGARWLAPPLAPASGC